LISKLFLYPSVTPETILLITALVVPHKALALSFKGLTVKVFSSLTTSTESEKVKDNSQRGPLTLISLPFKVASTLSDKTIGNLPILDIF
jgi:hypothetical protein